MSIITLENGLRPDGRYCVHLMSNEPIEYQLPDGVEPKRSVDAGACVLRAEWKYRGPCEIVCPEYEWRRVVVLWGLNKGERISEQAIEAARCYYDTFQLWPETVYLERMPQGVDYGITVQLPVVGMGLEGEMVVCDSDFIPKGFLAVGRTGAQPDMNRKEREER